MITCRRETKKAHPLDQEGREMAEVVEREEPPGKVLGHNQGGNEALKNKQFGFWDLPKRISIGARTG